MTIDLRLPLDLYPHRLLVLIALGNEPGLAGFWLSQDRGRE
jgi:hypothetical protein